MNKEELLKLPRIAIRVNKSEESKLKLLFTLIKKEKVFHNFYNQLSNTVLRYDSLGNLKLYFNNLGYSYINIHFMNHQIYNDSSKKYVNIQSTDKIFNIQEIIDILSNYEQNYNIWYE